MSPAVRVEGLGRPTLRFPKELKRAANRQDQERGPALVQQIAQRAVPRFPVPGDAPAQNDPGRDQESCQAATGGRIAFDGDGDSWRRDDLKNKPEDKETCCRKGGRSEAGPDGGAFPDVAANIAEHRRRQRGTHATDGGAVARLDRVIPRAKPQQRQGPGGQPHPRGPAKEEEQVIARVLTHLMGRPSPQKKLKDDDQSNRHGGQQCSPAATVPQS
jgi:hypothetical protein